MWINNNTWIFEEALMAVMTTEVIFTGQGKYQATIKKCQGHWLILAHLSSKENMD
jgi:hypothetical protein